MSILYIHHIIDVTKIVTFSNFRESMKKIHFVLTNVVDTNKFYLNTDPEFWPYLDPNQRLILSILKIM